MKKITLSVMAIAMMISLIAGSAYALFSSTATVSGVTFSTGNATLQVWDKSSSTWGTDYLVSDFLFQNMYPSYTTFQTFSLKNASTSNISLKLNAKLRNGATEFTPGDWDILKDKIFVSFADSSGTVLAGPASLNYWNSTGADFDTGLTQGANRWYRIIVTVDSGAGNEISDAGLSAMKFDFLGTQE